MATLLEFRRVLFGSLALGASTGSGVYASNTATLDGGDHGSLTYGHTAFAGADASANAWSHATRNEDGDVNGWTVGADARAFAGAELKHTFAAEAPGRSEEHTSELQSRGHLVCRLLLEQKK